MTTTSNTIPKKASLKPGKLYKTKEHLTSQAGKLVLPGSVVIFLGEEESKTHAAIGAAVFVFLIDEKIVKFSFFESRRVDLGRFFKLLRLKRQ